MAVKHAPAPGDPILTSWARPRSLAEGGTPASDRLQHHPKLYWLCKARENNPNTSTDLPPNPSNVSGLTIPEYIARRLVEHARHIVSLGASMENCSFFIQNFGSPSGSGAGLTPALHRSEDDAVGVAAESDNFNCIFSARARTGPLEVQPERVPIEAASAAYRDALKAELQLYDLPSFGWWTGDTEQKHEPWHWSKGSGGVWTAMVNDERAGTEVICPGRYQAGHNADDPGTDLTLEDAIAQIMARTPTFDPEVNQNYTSATNQSRGVTREYLNLRADVSHCDYARVTVGIWKDDPFFEDLVISNYSMYAAANPSFPYYLTGNGGEFSDHNARYFGLDAHAMVTYAIRDSGGGPASGFARFSPRHEIDPARGYDPVQFFAIIRRLIASVIYNPSAVERDKPITPWLRGCDSKTEGNTDPPLTAEDLAGAIRLYSQHPQVRNIVLWVDDTNWQHVNWEETERALLIRYPHITWSDDLGDWEVAA